MIRVWRSGPHAHRMPFSYPHLAPLFDGAIVDVARPEEADLHVYAHFLDLEDMPQDAVLDWRRRQRPTVILSEEPFWDTIWGHKPLLRHRVIDTRFGAVPVVQLNHHTSGIFDFDRIPYYLLTHPRFAQSYAHRFVRNATLTPTEWQTAFATRRAALTFMFERRPESYHDVRWPEADIIGLCAWRTDLAEAFAPGEAERLGQSWQGGLTRFELADWYLDKMARLDGHARILSALENTHQPNYVTEKIFDSFACGSLPLYHAGPGHRIHDFALPREAWLNLHDLTPQEAADRVRAWEFDAGFFEAFHHAQGRLKTLFTDPNLFAAERARLRKAVINSLTEVLDGE